MHTKKQQSLVYFHFLSKGVTLRDRASLKSFITKQFKAEGVKLERLDYIFCSDEYLLEMNRQHLKHDFYTDIITFNLSEKNQPITGEVYISIDRVKDNAKTLNQPLNRELHRVIFHGVLHLCGYKDKTPKDSKAMRAAEDRYLQYYLKG
jgi:probable rRNA maturation factor